MDYALRIRIMYSSAATLRRVVCESWGGVRSAMPGYSYLQPPLQQRNVDLDRGGIVLVRPHHAEELRLVEPVAVRVPTPRPPV